MSFPRLLLIVTLGFASLPAQLVGATTEESVPKKTKRELRKETKAAYFDAKLFAAAVPPDTVVYARIGSQAAFTDALRQIRPFTTASLLELPKGQASPWATKRDILSLFNPRPNGPVQCSVLALVNATGEVVRVFISEAAPRSFGLRLAETVATWKYHPAKIDGVAVPAIVFETFSAGLVTYVYLPGITFDQSDKADFLALKKAIADLYDAKQFAAPLPARIMIWPSDLSSSPVFQKGLAQLRSHTQAQFIAYPETAPPVFIDRQDEATYPIKHKRKGKEGEADVFLLVNSTGRIVKFYVAGATDEIFAAAAIHALTNWVFTPAVIEGNSVPFLTMQTVKFTLQK